MQRKVLSMLCMIAVVFAAGCGNSTSNDQSATSAPATTAPKPAAANCATSANNAPAGNQMLFGDPTGPGPDSSRKNKKSDDLLCGDQGICDAVSSSGLAVKVGCQYTQGVGGNPSLFVLMFPYQQVLKNQPGKAIFFYNNVGGGSGPIANYQFKSAFDLARLGGNFATVCGTINPAVAGVITYTPAIAAPFPVNAQMNSNVVVTFTVIP